MRSRVVLRSWPGFAKGIKKRVTSLLATYILLCHHGTRKTLMGRLFLSPGKPRELTRFELIHNSLIWRCKNLINGLRMSTSFSKHFNPIIIKDFLSISNYNFNPILHHSFFLLKHFSIIERFFLDIYDTEFAFEKYVSKLEIKSWNFFALRNKCFFFG